MTTSNPAWKYFLMCFSLFSGITYITYEINFKEKGYKSCDGARCIKLPKENSLHTGHVNLPKEANGPNSLDETRREECANLSFSFTPLPVTALASYPGSGNTWMRHLLQRMTGIYTGSVYMDTNLMNGGFPGERRQNGSVVAIKTHFPYKRTSKHYDKVLLLIRNPFEALLAEFKRRKSSHKSHVGEAKLEHYIKGWNEYCVGQAERYRRFYLSWINHTNVLIISYDDLKADLVNTLSGLYSFLNNGNLKKNIQCCIEDPEGKFHRHPSQIPLDFYYDEPHITRINNIILELEKTFSARFRNNTFHYMKNWIMK